ncbi:kinesin light chain [Xylariaceae sp. FL0016]|nr:kinesin light chain [Xylariaceae sp. FL0016]
MRLLQLDDQGRLSLTDDLLAGHVPPYAILSHTWGPEEVTFLDMSRSDNPWEHKAGHGKIKLCADLARRDGLRHVWVDTCCIDKSDAIELQTAINSMFKWYRNAERCYVYLHDVPNRNEFHGRHNDTRWEDAFRNSRWFTRGWTLQELIAPKRVDFYSEKGDLLGDKTSLESLICDITHIPARALRGEPLPTFTIQERMAWARNRHTKYEEDMAYCLFGIFDIHMPLIYGEGGEGALKRLREEVQKATRGSLVTDFSITFSLFDVPEIQYFVARKGELEEMRGALVSDGSRRIVTLQGLGGLGKTQLAIEYAKHHRDDHSATFWINVKDETSVRQSFTRVARQILQQHPNASRLSTLDLQSDNEEAIESVKAWLSLPGNTRWLVVYDNYDNPRSAGSSDDSGIDIQRFLPTAHQGAIIITTRSALVDLGHQIRMRKLQDFNDCLEILSKTSGRVQLEKDTDVQRLIDELDGLPLALATAGAYLKRVSCTLGRYLFLYKSSWERLHTSAPRLGSYRDRTLCSTWQISYDQVLQCNPLAANLLRWWAYFDNEDIWFELFRSCREDSPAWVHELTEELNFNSAMIVLHDYGFVEPHTSGPDQIQSTGYSIHSCLHTWTIHVLNRERNEQLSRLAIHCVALGITDFNVEGGWKLVKRLLSHAMAVSTNAKVGDERLSADFLLLGDLFVRQYKLRDAQHMYRLTHQGRENAFGPDHELTIAALHALIFVHDILEEYPVAEEMCSRILIRREKALGPDHQDTLATVYSLASLYEKQGKPQAEEILAWLYEKQGKPQAEEMYLRALQGEEKALGPDHLNTLGVAYNLGLLYLSKRRFIAAEEISPRHAGYSF